MKFTIFGSSGFIGANIVSYLESEGYECFCPKRDEITFKENLGHVIYAIGLTSDFRIYPLETINAHICILKEILKTCSFKSFTYLSSTRVYQNSNKTSEDSNIYINPNNLSDLYNISKIMGESICLNSGLKNIKIARLSNIIGQRADSDFFISQLLKDAQHNGKIIFQSSPDSKKDYLFIDDAIYLLKKIAISEQCGIFNVASGKNTTNMEISKLIENKTNFKTKFEKDAPQLLFPQIDISRIQKEFNFLPQIFYNYFTLFLDSYTKERDKNDLF